VEAIPSSLSPASEIEKWFFNPGFVELDRITPPHFYVTYSDRFRETRERLQRQDVELRHAHLNENPISSNEAFFIYYLLKWGLNMAMDAFPELMSEAIQTALKDPARIASEWQSFATEFYTSRGRLVPDWGQYVEIQEELRLIGKASFHRVVRLVKKQAQRILRAVLNKVCISFPDSKEARKKRCQLIATTSNKYSLESGGFWCQ